RRGLARCAGRLDPAPDLAIEILPDDLEWIVGRMRQLESNAQLHVAGQRQQRGVRQIQMMGRGLALRGGKRHDGCALEKIGAMVDVLVAAGPEAEYLQDFAGGDAGSALG